MELVDNNRFDLSSDILALAMSKLRYTKQYSASFDFCWLYQLELNLDYYHTTVLMEKHIDICVCRSNRIVTLFGFHDSTIDSNNEMENEMQRN